MKITAIAVSHSETKSRNYQSKTNQCSLTAEVEDQNEVQKQVNLHREACKSTVALAFGENPV